MTNKKTDSADTDFDLNHFDQADKAESEKDNGFVESESFYTSDLFDDAARIDPVPQADNTDPFDDTLDSDPFAEPGTVKKEPSIPHTAQSGTDSAAPEPVTEQQVAPDNATEEAAIATAMPGDSSAPLADQRSGTTSITVFAILAMLVAGIAVWLNPGATNDTGDTDGNANIVESQPVLGTDIQMQRLEKRISSLEQQSGQQRDALNQKIDHLQQQLSALSGQVAKKTVSPPQSTRHAKTPVVRRKSTRPHASTSAVTSAPVTGWVVNLVSVDSQYAADKALKRYQAQGISAEIFPVKVKGKTWYRIRITGFANKQEAATQKKYLASKHGIKNAWVQKP